MISKFLENNYRCVEIILSSPNYLLVLQIYFNNFNRNENHIILLGCHGHDSMVVGFTTTCTISGYHHWCCEFESRSGQGTTLCDKVCKWLTAGLWFSQSTKFSSTNKTDSHDITEILLKVALNTIKQTYYFTHIKFYYDKNQSISNQ